MLSDMSHKQHPFPSQPQGPPVTSNGAPAWEWLGFPRMRPGSLTSHQRIARRGRPNLGSTAVKPGPDSVCGLILSADFFLCKKKPILAMI